MSGSHRSEDSMSVPILLGALVPTVGTAAFYLALFVVLRGRNRRFYAPRTYFGSIPEKDRTPSSEAGGKSWFHDFRKLPDRFVLQHISLDAFLFLRFLKFLVIICCIGCCITWPILMPLHAIGGGRSTQLDKINFSNIAKKKYLWAHVAVSWVFFGGVLALIVRERLRLVGTRQAFLLDKSRTDRLSSRTVLFLNVPHDALKPENRQQYFGQDAEHSWPVENAGDLDKLVAKRKSAAFKLESAQLDLIKIANKRHRKGQQLSQQQDDATTSAEQEPLLPRVPKSFQKILPFTGTIHDTIKKTRDSVVETTEKINHRYEASDSELPGHSGIFVSFSDQAAAHRAYEKITFKSKLPTQARFLNVEPKEAVWNNLTIPVEMRLSRASLALAFVVAFIIFYSIPSGLIGTISNVSYLADNVSWLRWLQNLPDWVLGLLSGLVPPLLTSWFQSYVPKLFRHIAKYSGEPTIPQAELKTQAWTFVFQITQVFLVTTFSSGAAAIARQTVEDPLSIPTLLAEALPKSSNFYLTYFILQGTANAASNVLNYSDLLESWFFIHYWDKTPREKFSDYSQMKGMSWGAWYPKFTNLFVIAIAYSCIAPLVTGFAVIGIFLYYLVYRYNILYVRQCKIDTRGECYQRALQQMVAGIYLAQLCLIGLFGISKAPAQAGVMIAQIVVFAVANAFVDRTLRPLELYLGLDTWTEQEVPFLAQEEGISEDDYARLHAASHARRLGLQPIGTNNGQRLSMFFDSVISASRNHAKSIMHEPSARHFHDEDSPQISEEDLKTAYIAPAFTSKPPKLWIPKDGLGISKQVIQENEAVGIPTTDEGAEVDEKGRLSWTHDFEEVPIFSKQKLI